MHPDSRFPLGTCKILRLACISHTYRRCSYRRTHRVVRFTRQASARVVTRKQQDLASCLDTVFASSSEKLAKTTNLGLHNPAHAGAHICVVTLCRTHTHALYSGLKEFRLDSSNKYTISRATRTVNKFRLLQNNKLDMMPSVYQRAVSTEMPSTAAAPSDFARRHVAYFHSKSVQNSTEITYHATPFAKGI